MEILAKADAEAGSSRVAGKAECMKLDLGDDDSIRSFAKCFSSRAGPTHDKLKRLNQHGIALLVNNAGIMGVPEYGTAASTTAGRNMGTGSPLMAANSHPVTHSPCDEHMRVNHLGPFLLTSLLLQSRALLPGARIVNVASEAHRRGVLHVLLWGSGDDGEGHPSNGPARGASPGAHASAHEGSGAAWWHPAAWFQSRPCTVQHLPGRPVGSGPAAAIKSGSQAGPGGMFGYWWYPSYAASKLANVLFTTELQRRMDIAGENIATVAVSPGRVNTNIFSSLPTPWRVLLSPLASLAFQTPEEGARSVLHAATSPDIEGLRGHYVHDCKITAVSAAANNASLAKALWEASVYFREKLKAFVAAYGFGVPSRSPLPDRNSLMTCFYSIDEFDATVDDYDQLGGEDGPVCWAPLVDLNRLAFFELGVAFFEECYVLKDICRLHDSIARRGVRTDADTGFGAGIRRSVHSWHPGHGKMGRHVARCRMPRLLYDMGARNLGLAAA
eukprot:jgi/Mesvir1/28086/Mv04677-RA.1